MQLNGVYFVHHIHRFSYINLPQKSMRWTFVRNAVENNFHRVFLTSFCGACVESRGIFYFHRVLSVIRKRHILLRFRGLFLRQVFNFLYHCSTCHLSLFYFLWIQLNVGKQMRQIFVRNAVKLRRGLWGEKMCVWLYLF